MAHPDPRIRGSRALVVMAVVLMLAGSCGAGNSIMRLTGGPTPSSVQTLPDDASLDTVEAQQAALEAMARTAREAPYVRVLDAANVALSAMLLVGGTMLLLLRRNGPWWGVELGYSHYVLVDGFGGGDVHAGFFGGYLGLGRVRLGGSLDLGGRDYSLGQADALARVTLIGGYQHLPWRPFVPYAGLVATAGLLVGKRFRTPLTHAILGGGLEVGADYNLVRSLYLGASLAYLRADVSGIGYDLWILRLRVGL